MDEEDRKQLLEAGKASVRRNVYRNNYAGDIDRQLIQIFPPLSGISNT